MTWTVNRYGAGLPVLDKRREEVMGKKSKLWIAWMTVVSVLVLGVQSSVAYNWDNSVTDNGITMVCAVSGVGNAGVRWFLIMMNTKKTLKISEWRSRKDKKSKSFVGANCEEKHFALKYLLHVKHRLFKRILDIEIHSHLLHFHVELLSSVHHESPARVPPNQLWTLKP